MRLLMGLDVNSDPGDIGPPGNAQVMGSVLSMLGYGSVCLTYGMFWPLRRHPASLMLWMSVFGLAFDVLFIVEYYVPNQYFGCRDAMPLAHFLLIGQEMYFLMLALDLLWVSRNPFTVSSLQVLYYHVTVLCVSTGYAIFTAILAINRISLPGFCWVIANASEYDESYEWWSYMNLLGPIALIFTIAGATYVSASARLKRGLPKQWAVREPTLRQLRVHVLGFLSYWTVIVVAFLLFRLTPSLDNVLSWSILRFIYGGRGVVNGVLWGVTQRVSAVFKMYKACNWDEALQVDSVNWTLRNEVMEYAMQGLCESLQKNEGRDSVEEDTFYYTFAGAGVLFVDLHVRKFSKLRRLFGISVEKLLNSIRQPVVEQFSEGNSGAFMYFAGDERDFLLKTCTAEEQSYLSGIVSQYTEYISSHRQSLLCKYIATFQLRLYGTTLRFVAMQSIWHPHPAGSIRERFDLKGSWIGRMAGSSSLVVAKSHPRVCKFCGTRFVVGMSQGGCTQRALGGHVSDTCGKDLDWAQQRQGTISVRKSRLLRRDVEFLAGVKSMDYSLLLGTRTRDSYGNPQAEQLEEDGDICFVGIIDILTTWSVRKRLERFVKVHLQCQDASGISCTDPRFYADRFTANVIDALSIEIGSEEDLEEGYRIIDSPTPSLSNGKHSE